MAGRSKDILLRFLVDDKQKSKLAGIGTEAGKTQSKFSQLSGGAKAVVGGMAAIAATKIISFLGDAAAAALADEAAQKQLALALENTVGATDAQIEAAEKFIDTTARASGVADDELRPALAELVRTTGDLETAQDTLGIAMDIAAAKGLPLETVTRAIGKAALGNVGALGRLGVATKNANGDTLTFEETLAEAARTMGGATAVAAETAEGKIRRMNVALDEAKESIGNVLIPILAQGAEAITNMDTVLGLLSDTLENIPGPAGTVVDTVKGLLGPFGLLSKTWELAAEQAQKIIDQQEALVAPLTVSADRYDEMTEAVEDNTTALQENVEELRAQMDPLFNLADKINDLATAQTNTGIARDKYSDGSPEHLEALRNEATAFLNLKDAQAKAALESGITRETYEGNLERMGILTREEINIMMEEFDRLDGRIVDTTIRVNLKGRGADTFSDAISGRRAEGGPVRSGETYLVGERGPELLTMNGNGAVTPNNQIGGATYAISVNAGMGANGQEIGKLIVEQIRQYEKRNGRGWRS